MSDGRRLILTPFTGRKKLKSVVYMIKEKHIPKKEDKIQLKQTGNHIAIKGMVSRIFRR